LALDEPKDNDQTYDNSSLRFLVDEDLMKNCGQITIDYHDAGYRSGFAITSRVPIGGGGGCGSSCGSKCG